MRRIPVDRRAAALAAFAAFATACVFLPAVRFPFLAWDDNVNIVQNPNLNFGVAGLRWMLAGSSLGHWAPLTWMTLALDRALWGGAAGGFHLTNVLLHALNAALFFLLARRLLGSRPGPGAAADAAALFAALFWALHPLRAEPVAWVSERRDMLSGALILGATLAYLRGADGGDAAEGARWRRIALALGVAAMAAKVFAVVLPGVLLIFDARLRGRPRWREKWPWALAAAASVALNMSAQAQAEASVPLSAFGVKARLAQAAFGFAFYAVKTVWPFGLSPFYEFSPLLEPRPFVLSAAFVLACAALVFSQRRRRPWLVHGALAYLFLVLPALGLFKSGRMTAANRYSYLPGLVLALAAGEGFRRWGRTAAARAGAGALLLALALLTRSQLQVWSSDVALWTRACRVSTLSYFARVQLSRAETAAGDARAGDEDAAAATRLHAEVFRRAAEIYAARGDADAARDASVKAGWNYGR